MGITYTLTFDEYRHANFLWLKYGSGKPKFNALLVTWLGPAIGILFLGASIFAFFTQAESHAPAVALLGIGLAAASLPLSHRRTLRRLYRLQGLADITFTAELGDAGLHLNRSDGRLDMNYDWSGFSKYAESPELFVLFTGKLSFVSIPKRALSPAQAGELQGFLSANNVELANRV
jgi:hypothetical protein